MEDFERPTNRDNVNTYSFNNVNFESKTFDDVAEVFNYEKAGETIDDELEAFRNSSSREQKEHNENFSFDDLDNDEVIGDSNDDSINIDGEDINDDGGSIEDYFSSAEFIIFLLDLAFVFGTNVYLKRCDLDSIGKDAFKRTHREQKYLLESISELMMKYNAKISVEMKVLFALGSSYGMKIKGIVKEQEIRTEERLKKSVKKQSNKKYKDKNGSEVLISKPRKDKEEEKRKEFNMEKDKFKLNVEGIKDVEEEVEKKNKKTSNADLITG